MLESTLDKPKIQITIIGEKSGTLSLSSRVGQNLKDQIDQMEKKFGEVVSKTDTIVSELVGQSSSHLIKDSDPWNALVTITKQRIYTGMSHSESPKVLRDQINMLEGYKTFLGLVLENPDTLMLDYRKKSRSLSDLSNTFITALGLISDKELRTEMQKEGQEKLNTAYYGNFRRTILDDLKITDETLDERLDQFMQEGSTRALLTDDKKSIRPLIEQRLLISKLVAEAESISIVRALGFSQEQGKRFVDVYESIVGESFDQMAGAFGTDGKFIDSPGHQNIVKAAIKDASKPGIAKAGDIVSVLLCGRGEQVTEESKNNYVQKLLGANLADYYLLMKEMLGEKTMDVPDVGTMMRLMTELIQEKNPENDTSANLLYFDSDKITLLQTMTNSLLNQQNAVLTQEERQDLLVMLAAVHVSWDGIQGLRTVKDKYEQLLTDNRDGLRTYAAAYRSYPAVVQTFFNDRLISKKSNDTDQTVTHQKAILRAVLEVMKDTVQFPKLENPYQSVLNSFQSTITRFSDEKLNPENHEQEWSLNFLTDYQEKIQVIIQALDTNNGLMRSQENIEKVQNEIKEKISGFRQEEGKPPSDSQVLLEELNKLLVQATQNHNDRQFQNFLKPTLDTLSRITAEQQLRFKEVLVDIHSNMPQEILPPEMKKPENGDGELTPEQQRRLKVEPEEMSLENLLSG